MWAMVMATCALAVGACHVTATFTCEIGAQCGAAGSCIDGSCAFPDSMCGSGLRYDEHAGGGRGGTCVGAEVDAAGGQPDAPPDALVPPGPPDAMVCSTTGLMCPSGAPVMFICGGDCWAGCQPFAGVLHADAVAACTAWGGRLAPLYGDAEAACVQAAIAPGTAMWTGLEQATGAATTVSDWSWNGDSLVPPYFDWGSGGGQPNDVDGVESGEEQCVFVMSNGDWHDVPCGNAINRFACRKP